MLQVPNHRRCRAAGKPAIHAWRSKANPANSQTADKDETALAVLARVSVVAHRLKPGDFVN
jgi:hypothetical protein|tara:strand:+ start:67 stop:249 length:183 start_codon:yes stop_codon:yes gene_type:complete